MAAATNLKGMYLISGLLLSTLPSVLRVTRLSFKFVLRPLMVELGLLSEFVDGQI